MDGVTKELAEYFEKLEKLGSMAMETIKEQIELYPTTPRTKSKAERPKAKSGDYSSR